MAATKVKLSQMQNVSPGTLVRGAGASPNRFGLSSVSGTPGTGDIFYTDATGDHYVQRLAAGSFNQILRIGSLGVPEWAVGQKFTGCRMLQNTAQSIATGVVTLVNFDTESWDSDGFADISTDANTVTIPAGLAGLYFVNAEFRTAAPGAAPTGTWTMATLVSSAGLSVVGGFALTNQQIRYNLCGFASLGTGATIELQVSHNLGVASNLNASSLIIQRVAALA